MKIVLFIFLLSVSLLIKSQLKTEIEAIPILIEFKAKQDFGSGFFYNDSNTLYFVTAKHVLFNPVIDSTGNIIDYALKSNKVSLFYYPRSPDIEDKKELKVDLFGLFESGNLGITLMKDIAIGRIGKLIIEDNYTFTVYNQYIEKVGQSSKVNTIGISSIESYENVKTGTDIYVLGYPKALGLKEQPQYDFSRPLIRKGIVAGKNNKLKTIIIDCPIYPGNSGSPVFQLIDADYKLIGIAIQFIPELVEWKNINYGINNYELVNSGYSVVESIENIEVLIKQFR